MLEMQEVERGLAEIDAEFQKYYDKLREIELKIFRLG